jgi:hypothetical protein
VEFQRFLRHILAEGVIGVRKWGQRKGHGLLSATGGERGLTVILIEGSSAVKYRNLRKRVMRQRGNCLLPADGIKIGNNYCG